MHCDVRFVYFFFVSSRRRHTRCALVTGVQTCALPICLQSATLFDRNFEDAAGLNAANFDGYTLFDLYAGYETGFGTLSFAVQNLADAQYITYYGKAGSPLDADLFAGRDRTFTQGNSSEHCWPTEEGARHASPPHCASCITRSDS